ncbi:MAG: 4Fe-4S dicluster domain-containing protein [Acidilobus sp.]
MESKGIHVVVDPSKCVGCNICELWCSYEHEGVFSRSLSRISVITYERLGFDYPVVCQQCEPAPCVELCPTGALSKGKLGEVNLDKGKCIGCRVCSEVCPYGAARMEPREARYPLICDLCGGEPMCVARCPTNALSLSRVTNVKVKPRNAAEAFAIGELKKLAEGLGVDVDEA